MQQHIPGTKIYRIHAHEFRDSFKSTARVPGLDVAPADFFIGHIINSLGYEGSPWTYPEHFRDRYLKVEPLLTVTSTPNADSETKKLRKEMGHLRRQNSLATEIMVKFIEKFGDEEIVRIYNEPSKMIQAAI